MAVMKSSDAESVCAMETTVDARRSAVKLQRVSNGTRSKSRNDRLGGFLGHIDSNPPSL